MEKCCYSTHYLITPVLSENDFDLTIVNSPFLKTYIDIAVYESNQNLKGTSELNC